MLTDTASDVKRKERGNLGVLHWALHTLERRLNFILRTVRSIGGWKQRSGMNRFCDSKRSLWLVFEYVLYYEQEWKQSVNC